MPVEPAGTWVFGYGSLMWNPGFAYAEARRARLTGYHRAFCIYSIHYRGNERRPGLVLGLDRGGVCEGMAFRLAPETAALTLAYLRRRELIYGVYREAILPLELEKSPQCTEPASPVWALAYIAERAHPAYAGRLPLAREAHVIRGATGRAGTNLDYVLSTRRHLAGLGIREARLDRLATLLGAIADHARCRSGGTGGTAALARSWAWKPHPAPRTVRDNRFGYRAKFD
jgi:cation transport protein ChaC